MAVLPNPVNTELKQGFTVPQVAEKHGWTEPLVWSIGLEGKDDLDRFKAVNWGLRTWDLWNWNDCDKRFGYHILINTLVEAEEIWESLVKG